MNIINYLGVVGKIKFEVINTCALEFNTKKNEKIKSIVSKLR